MHPTRRIVQLKYADRPRRTAFGAFVAGIVSYLDLHGVRGANRSAVLEGDFDFDVPEDEALAGDVEAIYGDFAIARERELEEVSVG